MRDVKKGSEYLRGFGSRGRGWQLSGPTLGWFLLGSLGALFGCSSQAPDDSVGPTYCADVQQIVQKKCVRCHSDPPDNGAPFPLVTIEDFDAPFPGHPELMVADAARDAVAAALMPLTSLELEPPVEPLEASEKKTLLSWLDNGRPPGQCK